MANNGPGRLVVLRWTPLFTFTLSSQSSACFLVSGSVSVVSQWQKQKEKKAVGVS